MADRIQQRRDTAARWAQFNPILLEGEIGYVLDNPNQYKIGDGVNAWNDLPLRGYTGTIDQNFGSSENAVISQKTVTQKGFRLFLQGKESYMYDVLANKFRTQELPPISDWTGVMYPDDTNLVITETNILENAPFLQTETDTWISIPMFGKIDNRGQRYAAAIMEWRIVGNPSSFDNVTNGIIYFQVPSAGMEQYKGFTKVKKTLIGNRYVFVGYFDLNDINLATETNLKLLLAIHNNKSVANQPLCCQLGGFRMFYMDDLEDMSWTVDQVIDTLTKKVTDVETSNNASFGGVYHPQNLFEGLTVSNKFIAANGVISEDANWEGIVSDYIAVAPGDIVFFTLNFNYIIENWAAIWGYSDVKGNGAVSLQAPGIYNKQICFVPFDGSVKYIRASHGANPYPANVTPVLYKTSSLQLISQLTSSNLFQPRTLTNQFLSNSGAVANDANYSGYLTPYIPVKPGQRYYVKGTFGYPDFVGNVWAYPAKSTTGAQVLAQILVRGEYRIVTIPEGCNYLRMCARADQSDDIAIILLDDEYGRVNAELVNQYFQDYKKTNDANISTLFERTNVDISEVKNRIPKIYCNVQDISGTTITEKNIAEDYFVYYKAGAGNEYAVTKQFVPSGNSLIHIKGKLELLKVGQAIGVSIWISNQTTVIAGGKFKQIATIDNDGDFDITIDTTYLIAHEGYGAQFYIWFNNITIPEGNGSITAKVTNWQVLEYENVVNASNISGSNAKELFESTDEQIGDIKKQIEGSSNELVSPEGNKFILSVTDDGTLTTIPVIPSKGAFFGNSLILGFSPYGMAASQIDKDYYYLITQYIKTLNPSFTALDRKSASAFEGLTTTDSSEINSMIQTVFLDNLTGDEDLVVIQLGDNVNTPEKNAAFPTTSLALCKALRKKCTRARIIWMGMWYAEQNRYQNIQDACNATGCQYIFFNGLNTSAAQNVIGGLTKRGSSTRTLTGVTNVTENSENGGLKNITVTFTVGSISYNSTLDVSSYSLNGTTLTYNSEYEIISSTGVASHPNDEGFRRIANRFLFETKLSDVEETYPA